MLNEKDTLGAGCSASQSEDAQYEQLWTKEEAHCHGPAKMTPRAANPVDLLEAEVSGHEPANMVLRAMNPLDLLEGELSGHKPADVTLGAVSPAALFEDIGQWTHKVDEKVPDTTLAGTGDDDRSLDMPLRLRSLPSLVWLCIRNPRNQRYGLRPNPTPNPRLQDYVYMF